MSKILYGALRTALSLSDKEMDELENFLTSDLTPDETLMLDGLDGYLTAIAIGPANLELDEWLPGVWGSGKESAPNFRTLDHERHIIDLIQRFYNNILLRLNDSGVFEPMFDKVGYSWGTPEYIEGEPWALGFMNGVALSRESWQPLFDDAKGWEWLRPLHLLGADRLTLEEEALVRWPWQRDKLAKRIPASVNAIYRYWNRSITRPTIQVARSSQKIEPKRSCSDSRFNGSAGGRHASLNMETFTVTTQD
jgi:uncharacterized protein